MPIHTLSSLERDVINSIIAQNEEWDPPETIRDYMRAFEGTFEPDMKFTLHTPTVNKLIMYVYEENCDMTGIPRAEFFARCKPIVQTFLAIANFVIYLAEHAYIHVTFNEHKPPALPENYQRCWRRYENFYLSESEPIIYVKSIKIIPKLKLYKLWERYTHAQIS
ncbi:MAG: hypothetical protein LBT14_09150 [Treponema sp.]|nr:hypothetical protein [Treponema sp.]